MTDEEKIVYEEIIKIIIKNLNVDPNKISLDSNLVYDLGADSLDIVTLVLDFENEFNKEIPDDIAKNIQTIGDIFNYIKSITNQG